MADRGLDPAGPILAVLFGAKSSDLVVDVVTGAGVRVDWSLNDRQNYSNSTRIREYRVRVAAALNALSDSQRLAALTSISRGLVGRKIGDADALNTALESTGWRLTDAGLVGTVHATPFDQPVKGVSASQLPTAVIVTALELEAVAAREHLREIGEQVHENGTVYFVGLFGDENPWQVAIVTAGAGNPTAALELERAIQSFKPSVVLAAKAEPSMGATQSRADSLGWLWNDAEPVVSGSIVAARAWQQRQR